MTEPGPRLTGFMLIHRDCVTDALADVIVKRSAALTVGVEGDGAPYVVAVCPECGHRSVVGG